MQTIENLPFVHAEIVYDEATRQFGYVMAVLQEDQSYEVSPVRSGFRSVEEAREAATLEYTGKRARQKAARQQANWRVLAQWLTFNCAATLLLAMLTIVMEKVLYGDSVGQFSPTPINVAILLAMPFFLGMLLGRVQWMVLQRYFPGMHWIWWVIATGIGALLGRFAGALSNTVAVGRFQPGDVLEILRWVLYGVLSGITLGVIQWMVLRRYGNQTAWWIVAMGLSGVISALMVGVSYQIFVALKLEGDQFYYLSLFATVIANCLGAIPTGIALMTLTQNTKEPEANESVRSALKLT